MATRVEARRGAAPPMVGWVDRRQTASEEADAEVESAEIFPIALAGSGRVDGVEYSLEVEAVVEHERAYRRAEPMKVPVASAGGRIPQR